MQSNENKPLIFTEKPEKESAFIENEREAIVSSMQLSNTPLVLNVVSNIIIPKGFRWNEIQPITWEVCIDKHLVHAVTTLLRMPTETSTALYFVETVGAIEYNRIINGLIPVDGGVYASSGTAAQGTTDTQTNATVSTPISAYNVIPINESVGYVNSIVGLENNSDSLFSIEIVDEFPSILLTDGTVVTYDPTNPTEFFRYFDGSSNYSFIVNSSAIITPVIEPGS